MGPRERALKLFGKAVYQSAPFTQRCQELGPGTAEQIVAVTAAHYPLFRPLRHGLVLGQLSEDLPRGYPGPGLEFIYKILAHKVYFAALRVGGFTQAELAAIEAGFDR
jgi:hypothetical protein